MMSLLEARKNVPLLVKSIARGGRGRRGRGRGRGMNLRRRFYNMGIREGTVIKKVSEQPFMGPIVIKAGNCQIAVGRGMANSILVEEIEK